ncbi:sugar phosphate isomerase/epimerase family protein [Chitinophaga nivalis]|uniref:Sugar phosphate isomerase/epimerase n=1 Tax=Chitinophaga nivalis TaxID=2991709 RepID=A0ABT3IGR8_9BACT|nr:sugar phosphate isomerase/epimerase family protein [Chitinophaga nivalis]MCW3467197.1 sugar phosphate isomerase/epimerase [Chitinophaga nivalis]MCW3483111.1 sugar phosphate isomerase/epimerase [Chitinophaga nivalis]
MKMKLLLTLTVSLALFLQSNAQTRWPRIGIATMVENDSLAAAAGFVCLEETVKKILSPAVSDSQFRAQLPRLLQARCRLQSCNVFIPGQLKLIGPAADEPAVLQYVETVMERAAKVGIQLIVLGSGEARRIPAGTDSTAAVQQFIRLVRKMADIAARHHCTIAIENLNRSETNFINTVAAANEIVQAVNHPAFKLTADIYHMLREEEPAAIIEKTAGNLVHCHIAEREKRAPPGVGKQDFRPYLAALHKIGYQGRIMLECRWENPAAQYLPAQQYLQAQIREVWYTTGIKK